MFPTLQVGSLSIQVPGIIILAGLWLGLNLSERRIRKSRREAGFLYNLVFIAIVSGVIGARLFYIISYPEAFSANPWNILSINTGLFDPYAGFLFGFTAGIIYVNRKKVSFWLVLDDLTPLLAVLAIAQGAAHLASGSAFGSPTTVPWGIYLWGTYRHPSQVYEIIFALLIFFFIYIFDQTKFNSITGRLFLFFTSLSAAYRLFLEAFRGDSLLIGEGFRQSQIISWLVLLVCLGLLGKKLRSFQDSDTNSN